MPACMMFGSILLRAAYKTHIGRSYSGVCSLNLTFLPPPSASHITVDSALVPALGYKDGNSSYMMLA